MIKKTLEVGGRGYQITLFGPRGANYNRHITSAPPLHLFGRFGVSGLIDFDIKVPTYVPVKQFYVRNFFKKMYLLNKVIQINFIWITFEEEIVLNSTKDMLEEISYSPTQGPKKGLTDARSAPR